MKKFVGQRDRNQLCAKRSFGARKSQLIIRNKFLERYFATFLLTVCFSILPSITFAEGTAQTGLTQPLNDISVSDTSRYIQVDILNGGEVINLSAVGGVRNAPNEANEIQFTIFDGNGLQIDQFTTAGAAGTTGKLSATNPMSATITNAYKFTPPSAGTYFVSMDDLTGSLLHRYDITVTANNAINPDPTGNTGIVGRVSAKIWEFDAGSFAETAATDANYFILTPGGFPNNNYVWNLDLNNFAGFVYDLKANGQGVDAPNSGFSTTRGGGNTVTEDFQLYLHRPQVALPEPVRAPTATGFTFTDAQGNDNSISPGGVVGLEEDGNFTFTTDATTATYAIYIDVNENGIFGDIGDVQLNGPAANGFNSVFYDGLDSNGDPLPLGNYGAELQVRLGEFHFVANDAETSGGNQNGLTVFRNTSGGDVSTLVYWDDVTKLGVAAGGTSTVPAGEASGTPGGFHSWGNFTQTGFGNERFIDTYVFGETTKATSDLNIVPNDDFSNATINITETSTPGDALVVTVTDSDQNTNPALADAITVQVTNDNTGEIETLTLTETGNDTGVFTANMPTTFGTVAGPDNDGQVNSQNGDTITVSYNDPTDIFGNPQTLTDVNTVSGGGNDGTVSITPTSSPGDNLTITVTDDDLIGNGTLNVTVVNDNSGESETLLLTESGVTPGQFEGTLPTSFGASAGTNNDGSLLSQNNDTITVIYNDGLTAAGGTTNRTDTNTVSGGSTGVITITPTSNPGDSLNITVTDTDLIANGPINVSVVNTNTGETETISLTENGVTAGLFEGTIATVFGVTPGTNDDGTINTQNGHSVVVTYNDSLTDNGSVASTTATDTVSGGADGSVSITPNADPGDPLTISVTDADLVGAGTLNVTAENSATGEIETITLTEINAGEFEGTVATVFGVTAGTNNDGTFNVESGETITVNYNDTSTAAGNSLVRTDTSTIGGGVNGTVTMTNNINPGNEVSVSVNDTDLSGAGTLTVNIVNTVTGEIETLILTENAVTPGLFEGTIDTVFGASAGINNDGVFNAEDADTLTVTYDDVLTSSGGTASVNAQTLVGGGTDAVVQLTPSSVPGETLTASVEDADRNTDAAVVDSVTVRLVNQRTGEIETLTLTETGSNTGVFLGTVATTLGASTGTNEDGQFNTQPADRINLTYEDLLTSGTNQTRSAASAVLGMTVKKVGLLNDGGDGRADLGDTITYNFTIQNIGAATLTNISISDPKVTVNGGPLASLPGGVTDTTTFTATYTLTPDDIAAGSVTNTATANAQGPGGTPIASISDDPTNSSDVDPDGDGNPSDPTVTGFTTNTAPTAVNDMAVTDEGQPTIVNVLDNDSDPDGSLIVTAVTQPTDGIVAINADGSLTVTPNAGTIGTLTFTYTVCDTEGACDVATVIVTVNPTQPEAINDVATSEPGETIIVSVLDNDTDPNGDVLIITDVTQPTGGMVTINNDGTLSVVADVGFEGDLSIPYIVCDPDENCDTATLIVTVDTVSPDAVSDVRTTPADVSVTFDPLVNDTDPNGDTLQIISVTQPPNGTVTINPDGTVTIAPNGGYVGDLTFTYTVCDPASNCDTATVTVSVEPPTATVRGVVFSDLNGDDTRQLNEPLEEGWIVEIRDEDGAIIATVLTDGSGFYEVANLPLGNYQIAFRNPVTNTVYGQINGITLNSGVTVIDQNLPIDPSGVVYNSVTRQPVASAIMTLADTNGNPLPPACLVDPSQQGQLTDTDGRYRFDIIPGAAIECPLSETVYRITYDAPDSFSDTASTIIAGQSLALNPPVGIGPFLVVPTTTAPLAGQDTTHYLNFVLGSGDRDVINNHIPLDPLALVRDPLVITKTTPQRDVSFGALVPYTITVVNTDDSEYVNLDIVDLTPPGFNYVENSARLNGVMINPVQNGRELVIPGQTLSANQTATLDMVLVVGSGVGDGIYVNQAFIRHSVDGSSLSNRAQASVQISPSPLFDCSEVIGKVFDDKNNDGHQSSGEDGIAGAKLVTVNGLIVTTDLNGRYHIACAALPNANIGSNFILKLDERSLPTGYRMTTENPRVMRLTRGKTSKMNFGASIKKVITLDLANDAFAPSDIRLTDTMEQEMYRLISILRQNEAVLRIHYHDYEGFGGLAKARLGNAERLLHSLWKSQGCCYALEIEQKLLSVGITQRKHRPDGR